MINKLPCREYKVIFARGDHANDFNKNTLITDCSDDNYLPIYYNVSHGIISGGNLTSKLNNS